MCRIRDRMIVFVNDLKNFNEKRLLHNYTESSFMSTMYFTDIEIMTLKTISIESVTLGESLDNLMIKRQDKDGEICSSHDLCPLYERYFGITKSDYNKRVVKCATKEWRRWKANSLCLINMN